jgi:hypothetical protein
MYVVVDELWQRTWWSMSCGSGWYWRPRPAPAGSDSELLTMVLVGECRGWDLETEAVACWREHRDLFPIVPERRRFNRRRALMHPLNAVRWVALAQLDLAGDRQCAVDSLPVPVMRFHLVPGSPAASDWRAAGASVGKVASKKQTSFGDKLHLLVTLGGVILDVGGGVILDCALAPAHAPDLAVGAELLAEHHDLLVLGDKGYISARVAVSLAQEAGITLFTVPRANRRHQLPPDCVALHGHWRQIIETVNEPLSPPFHIEENHAQRFWGLWARLSSKLAAHTLCLRLNRQAGAPAPLHLKHLVFPI